jgi:hypothetical protein
MAKPDIQLHHVRIQVVQGELIAAKAPSEEAAIVGDLLEANQHDASYARFTEFHGRPPGCAARYAIYLRTAEKVTT